MRETPHESSMGAAVVATVCCLGSSPSSSARRPRSGRGREQVSSVVSTWGTWLAVLGVVCTRCQSSRSTSGSVRAFGRPDPAVWRVPAHAPHVAVGRRGRVEEVVVAPLAVPDLVAEVARVLEDRSDRSVSPLRPVLLAVRIAARVARAGGEDFPFDGEQWTTDRVANPCRGRTR